jgi:uncharacterized damage-inducible protein DinB
VTARQPWFARRFRFDLAGERFPGLVERLRGTPARIEDRVRGLPPAVCTAHPEGTWSIQENVGHLLDLEPLWAGRVDDLEAGAERLRDADLENTKTHEAGHDGTPLADLLSAFRSARQALVSRLEGMDDELALRAALHPRLSIPMRTLDLAFFIAEHDDHHLVRISDLIRAADR